MLVEGKKKDGLSEVVPLPKKKSEKLPRAYHDRMDLFFLQCNRDVTFALRMIGSNVFTFTLLK